MSQDPQHQKAASILKEAMASAEFKANLRVLIHALQEDVRERIASGTEQSRTDTPSVRVLVTTEITLTVLVEIPIITLH